jgi:hypothetical protein
VILGHAHLRRAILGTTAIAAFVLTPLPTRAAAATAAAPRVVYTSPLDGAIAVHPETGVLVRFDRPLVVTGGDVVPALDVVGALSGSHAGRARLVDGDRALLFTPARTFVAGEHVDVTLRAAGAADTRFGFTTAARRGVVPALASSPEAIALGLAGDAVAGTATAGTSSPVGTALGAYAHPASPNASTSTFDQGWLFLASIAFSPTPVTDLMIARDSGPPLFYRELPGLCTDFKAQPNGEITYFDGGREMYYALDGSFAVVDSFACGNGYATDLHELRLLPDGHALLLGVDPVIVDMSQVVPGGNPAANVLGNVIQELDADKNVVFEWRSIDHFAVTDATHENLTAGTIDAVHANALESDVDGNILLSSRSMDEITKIDRNTGAVRWRWGGKNNEFSLVGDSLWFSHQHAIRRIANGHLTMFDNGNFRPVPYSRALEYDVDESARTATLVWQFRNAPDIDAFAMGYVQRLDDGSTVIGWGTSKPDVIEVAPDGNPSFQLSLPPGQSSYRALRQPWGGSVTSVPPTAGPRLALSQGTPNPSRDGAALFLTLARAATVGCGVFDVRGRRVLSVLDHAAWGAGTYRIQVDLGGQPAGVYFARVTTDAGALERRLVHLE